MVAFPRRMSLSIYFFHLVHFESVLPWHWCFVISFQGHFRIPCPFRLLIHLLEVLWWSGHCHYSIVGRKKRIYEEMWEFKGSYLMMIRERWKNVIQRWMLTRLKTSIGFFRLWGHRSESYSLSSLLNSPRRKELPPCVRVNYHHHFPAWMASHKL